MRARVCALLSTHADIARACVLACVHAHVLCPHPRRSQIEFAPTAAIVGGLVASEVIKIIDGTWRPVNNALFVDGTTSDGLVQRLGPAFERASGSVDTGAFKPLKA